MFKAIYKPTISCVRLYSQNLSAQRPKKSRFDKSMIKPAIVLIVFGSMLTNVMEQQKKNSELERRYSLKLKILRDLIDRVKKENDTSFDPEEELRLVNKIFDRYETSKFVKLEEEATKARELTQRKDYSRKDIIDSLNFKSDQEEEESLQALFNDIMKDIEETGQPLKGEEKQEGKNSNSSSPQQPSPKEEIVTDRKVLAQEAEKEKERLQYKLNTKSHVIVENPGEYASAAEENKVSKFL